MGVTENETQNQKDTRQTKTKYGKKGKTEDVSVWKSRQVLRAGLAAVNVTGRQVSQGAVPFVRHDTREGWEQAA